MQVDEHHFLPLKSADDPFFVPGDISWHLKFNRPGISASGTEAEVARVARRVASRAAFYKCKTLALCSFGTLAPPVGEARGAFRLLE